MRDLSPLDSQKRVLELLNQRVLQNANQPTRTFLRGPSGCGKTWIIREISRRWPGTAVLASGEAALARRSYGAWWLGISATGPRLSRQKAVAQGASAAGRAVPFVGPLVAYLADLLATNRSRVRRDQALYLKSDEFEILSHLDAFARHSDLLLVADDLQHWDPDSLQMLSLVLSGKLDDIFSFLARVSLLITWNDEEGNDSTAAFSSIKASLPEPIHLAPVALGEMDTALKLFGFGAALDPAQLEMLHLITGGHLELLRQLTQYLNANPDGTDFTTLIQGAFGSGEIFLASILARRLLAAGEAGRSTLTALEAAAVIGKTFSVEELKCLLQTSRVHVDQCLEAARTFGLLVTADSNLTFTHEILRSCLILHAKDRTAPQRRKFADCLSLLRPFDYLSRAELLRSAGRLEDAARLYFAGIYKQLRDGNSVPANLRYEVFDLLTATKQDGSAERILRGHELILARQFSEVATLFAACENTDHPMFVAERLHLLGLARLQSVPTSDRREAVAILLRTAAVAHEEKELEIRVKLTLLTGYVHLEMWDEARRLDQEICATLAALQRTDPGAREGLEIHRRKSGMLYGAEIAAERCMRAAKYFGPPEGLDWPPRNPVQFFMAQCNLGGNLIVAGKFEQADEACLIALDIWSRLQRLKMPRVEKAINNSIVAGALVTRLRASEAVTLLQELRAQNTGGVFSRLIRNNCAVFHALSGEIAEALVELQNLSTELEEEGIHDEFYRYFVFSNLAGVLHLSGQSARGRQIWSELDDSVPNIPESDRHYLKARQELQSAAFDSVAPGDAAAWNEFLHLHWPHHLGPGWKFYGRGLLLTDTQIWLES